jgi:hypothetical protein
MDQVPPLAEDLVNGMQGESFDVGTSRTQSTAQAGQETSSRFPGKLKTSPCGRSTGPDEHNLAPLPLSFRNQPG